MANGNGGGGFFSILVGIKKQRKMQVKMQMGSCRRLRRQGASLEIRLLRIC